VLRGNAVKRHARKEHTPLQPLEQRAAPPRLIEPVQEGEIELPSCRWQPVAPLRAVEAALGERDRLAPHSVAEVGLRVALPGDVGRGHSRHSLAEPSGGSRDDRLPILGAEAFETAKGALPELPGEPASLLLDAPRTASEAVRALRELPHDPAPPGHPE